MKPIKLNNINETIYYEKLPNGLDVYLYNQDKFHNNYVTFTTKFGSIYNEFTPIDENAMLKVPNGVAHFLEHKVFSQEEDPQPDDFFANNGATCNAYTTFKNTTYLFSGASHLEENINYLLDFVQSPYFPEESVENEKGIITQEINMCNDHPADILYEHIRQTTLKNNPFKESVIGTTADINKIDKELLNTCYNTFYHPENMFLVVTGNFERENILQIIKENQAQKTFSKWKNIKYKEFQEPDEVVKQEEIIYMETNIPKVSYNIKINAEDFDIPKRKLNLYLYTLFSILFDVTSDFDEKMKQEEIITNSLSINILNCDTHYILSLINETHKDQELLQNIKQTLQKIKISSEDLERKKRVLISNELFSFENIEVINEMIIDNIIFENKIEENTIELIESMNIEELEKIISSLNCQNTSTVIIKKDNLK